MLSKAMPGKPSKQAPRMPVALLMVIEKFLIDPSKLPYLHIYAWFMALQNWATLRFSDHRGLLPDSIGLGPSGCTAVLSRSKTLGTDKNVLSRPVRVDSSCFVAEPLWLETGLRPLRDVAPFSRDYLKPAPEKNFTSCRSLELKYEIGHAVQNRVMASLSYKNTSFPGSGHVLLDTAQRSVVSSKLLRSIGVFLRRSRLPGGLVPSGKRRVDGAKELRARNSSSHFQRSWDPAPEVPDAASCFIETVPEDTPIMDDDLALLPVEPGVPAVKKKRGGQAALRTELFGEKESRARIPESLPQGVYLPLWQAFHPHSPPSRLVLCSARYRLSTVVLFWCQYTHTFRL